MHDKYVIVDQKMYLLGGRNTTNLFLGDYSRSKNIDRELFVYETAENDSSSIRQLTDYFESVWALSDSKEYTCKKMTKKIQSCKAKLENRYTSLKEKYPDAYSTWDYEALTLQTNKVSLLSNPIKIPRTKSRGCGILFIAHDARRTGAYLHSLYYLRKRNVSGSDRTSRKEHSG